MAGSTAVVNYAGVEDIRLAEICARRGTVYVDISASSDHVRALERIPGPVLLGVGLAPGLSTLLAAVVVRESSRRRITRATWIHEILDAATVWGDLSAYGLELQHS